MTMSSLVSSTMLMPETLPFLGRLHVDDALAPAGLHRKTPRLTTVFIKIPSKTQSHIPQNTMKRRSSSRFRSLSAPNPRKLSA